MSDPLADIRVSDTAREKRGRYLSPAQLRDALRTETGHVCRRTSPNHDGLYDSSKFLFRGTFADRSLDIVFVVERDRTVVVTQMSQHADSVRGRFYETVGTTARDAVESTEATSE
jgi:hypothetical protein